jgi:hypothetical protein
MDLPEVLGLSAFIALAYMVAVWLLSLVVRNASRPCGTFCMF